MDEPTLEQQGDAIWRLEYRASQTPLVNAGVFVHPKDVLTLIAAVRAYQQAIVEKPLPDDLAKAIKRLQEFSALYQKTADKTPFWVADLRAVIATIRRHAELVRSVREFIRCNEFPYANDTSVERAAACMKAWDALVAAIGREP